MWSSFNTTKKFKFKKKKKTQSYKATVRVYKKYLRAGQILRGGSLLLLIQNQDF